MRSFIFLAAFLAACNLALGQFTSQYPPEPMSAQDTTKAPCGEGDGEGSIGIPPPVGRCLPINDYLFPLFISGVALGAWSLFYLQQKSEIRNSAV